AELRVEQHGTGAGVLAFDLGAFVQERADPISSPILSPHCDPPVSAYPCVGWQAASEVPAVPQGGIAARNPGFARPRAASGAKMAVRAQAHGTARAGRRRECGNAGCRLSD